MKSIDLLRSAAVAVLLASLVAGAALAADDRGEQLFQLCVQCHGSAGQGNRVALAPAIAGMDQWYVEAQLKYFRNGARGTHPDDTGGLRMHPMSLTLKTDDDIADVAGYVASLPRAQPDPVLEGGNAKRGAGYYAVCQACHGPDGAGNQTVNAPRLTHASDWYLLTSLQKYKAGIRGSNPLNPYGAAMLGMSQTLPDEQAMKDVIAYIGSLEK